MSGTLKNFLVVGFGSILMGISINLFYVPHHLLSSGISGIAMIFYFQFGIPIGIMSAILNIPLFIIAYKLLSKEYFFIALYGTFLVTVSLDATVFLANYLLVDDILLSALCGGAFMGLGSGIVFRYNGSTGGTDILASLAKKYYAMDVGLMGFAINLIVMFFAAFLYGIKPALYTLIGIYLTSRVIDAVIAGFNHKKMVFIISTRHLSIANAILSELGRGVTFLDGQGAYTKKERKVIFVALTLMQIPKIKTIVEREDPKAFMIIQDAAEIAGSGFN